MSTRSLDKLRIWNGYTCQCAHCGYYFGSPNKRDVCCIGCRDKAKRKRLADCWLGLGGEMGG